MTTKTLTSRELGKAICDHLGIDISKHRVQSDYAIQTEPGELAKVTLTVLLGAEDLAGIAKHAMNTENFQHHEVRVSTAEALYGEGPEIMRAAAIEDEYRHRLDKISALLESIEANQTCGVLNAVQVAPGQ